MFLNFQNRADIRAEIIDSFATIKRAATAPEIASAIWFRSGIDGTRPGVHQTVLQEIRRMVREGAMEVADVPYQQQGETYYWPDVLTRLAIIE
jgi:hypothetical protein